MPEDRISPMTTISSMSSFLNEKNTDSRNLFVLWGIFAGVRLISFLLSENAAWDDEVTRSVMAQEWLKSPFFITSANAVTWVFGPLHCYLNATALALWNDPLSAPRLVCLIFGILSLWPFYKIVQAGFDSKTAFWSSLFLAFYTLHVKVSGIAVSESITIFLLLFAILFCLRYQKTEGLKYIMLAALFLTLSAMMRYDTWIMIPALALYFGFRSLKSWPLGLRNLMNRLVPVALLLLVGFSFPSLWMWGNYQTHGDPLFTIHSPEALYAPSMERLLHHRGFLPNLLYDLAFLPGTGFFALSPLVFLLGLFGIFYVVAKRKYSLIFYVAVVFVLQFIYQYALSLKMYPVARFTIIPTIFLLPYAGAGLTRLEGYRSKTKQSIMRAIIIVTIVLSFTAITLIGGPNNTGFYEKFTSISPLTKQPHFIHQTLDYLRTNLSLNETLFLDSKYYYDRLIRLYLYQYGDRLKGTWQNQEEMADYLLKEKPDYVIYSLKNKRVKNVFESSSWPVYSELRRGYATVLRAGEYIVLKRNT